MIPRMTEPKALGTEGAVTADVYSPSLVATRANVTLKTLPTPSTEWWTKMLSLMGSRVSSIRKPSPRSQDTTRS
jgi:hypothetical protein